MAAAQVVWNNKTLKLALAHEDHVSGTVLQGAYRVAVSASPIAIRIRCVLLDHPLVKSHAAPQSTLHVGLLTKGGHRVSANDGLATLTPTSA